MEKNPKPLNFFKVVMKDYRVGALTRSSRYTTRKVIEKIRPDWKLVVEYGAGDGVITKRILDSMPEDGKLIAVEINEDFTEELNKIKDKDPRLTVIHGNVKKVLRDFKEMEVSSIDAVISGIPLTFFPPTDRKEIVEDTHSILKDGGSFVVYQFSPLMISLLEKSFSSVEVSFELRNFPPYFIMEAKK